MCGEGKQVAGLRNPRRLDGGLIAYNAVTKHIALEQDYVGVYEASSRLGIHPGTVKRLCRQGDQRRLL